MFKTSDPHFHPITVALYVAFKTVATPLNKIDTNLNQEIPSALDNDPYACYDYQNIVRWMATDIRQSIEINNYYARGFVLAAYQRNNDDPHYKALNTFHENFLSFQERNIQEATLGITEENRIKYQEAVHQQNINGHFIENLEALQKDDLEDFLAIYGMAWDADRVLNKGQSLLLERNPDVPKPSLITKGLSFFKKT